MVTKKIIKRGDSGATVSRLQQLMNEQLKPSPKLIVDGKFGNITRNAVVRFQEKNWLSNDGIVGPATWGTLEKRDKYVILHNVKLIPQHTPSTCWSAALAMLLGVQASMSPGNAQTAAGGGMFNDAELSKPDNTKKFANFYGLKLLNAQSWMPDGLANMLRTRGPLMMNMLWNAPKYIAGHGSSGHMMIIAGIRGDGTPEGTTLRIYDPLPMNRGSKYSLTYGPFMRKMPVSTYQLYHK
jgi:hypothetical protein